MYKKETGTQEK